MIIRFQSDSHYLTCHKKSRLLFVLLTSVRQAVTVHSSVCVVRTSHAVMCISQFFLLTAYMRHMCANDYSVTVTCRQFLNLTFAPRKTCHLRAATSRFDAIMSQLFQYIRQRRIFQAFSFKYCIFFRTIRNICCYFIVFSRPYRSVNICYVETIVK